MVDGIPPRLRAAVETLWRYHDLGHELRPCDVGIGLGGHDLGVAVVATQLFHREMFPLLLFTGANAPTSEDIFPRGEAVHYREYAVAHGVPSDRVLIETNARNTQENLMYARDLLAAADIFVHSVLLMSRPYQQRRAFATCRKVWPSVEVVSTSLPMPLDDYVACIGDAEKVINMIVGDTQRIRDYPRRGFAIEQEMPDDVRAALDALVAAGYTARLIPH